ncbi:hypothetical protein DM01DRAFT_1298682 [Hesseltinella vesiculosa]|uniref:REM-1 domain-containing protein n=1 Tax=Hesseltinella vesiculosa TaxID=101127 RepID=A0A1X2GVP6_9FUNG|nr:hypothetical protein DM01DRAFT_1298682 [Hesseltinella vesiculosa]
MSLAHSHASTIPPSSHASDKPPFLTDSAIPPAPPPPPLPSKAISSEDQQNLEEWLMQLDREKKMKLGVENMLEVYLKDKKRTKDLESQLENYNATILSLTKRIDELRLLAGNDSDNTNVIALLRKHNYPMHRGFPATAAKTKPPQQRVGKPRSNSSPSHRQKQQHNISFPDDDAWPLGKRLRHIVEQLSMDEWKSASPKTDGSAFKESKMETLDVLVRILKNTADIDVYHPKKNVIACLRQCIASPNRELRVLGFRALRHLVNEAFDVEVMMQLHMDIFIVRAMTRDSDYYEPEREQALKLIRTFLQVGGAQYLSQSIVRAVTAVAEQTDCRLRNVCLETLSELAVLDIALTVRAGGLRVILQALLDGHLNMTEVLCYALVYILDTPERRKYMRPGVELETLIAPFTEASKGATFEERLKNSVKVVTFLLKTWAGILYMCANNMRAARSIVLALRTPESETKKMVLDMFVDIFRVQLPKDYDSYLNGRQHNVTMFPPEPKQSEVHGIHGMMMMGDDYISSAATMFGLPSDGTNGSGSSGSVGTTGASAAGSNSLASVGMLTRADGYRPLWMTGVTSANNRERLNMLDQHLSVVLIIFIEADILSALIDLVKSDDVYLSRKATLLIGEILQLSTRLLPMLMASQVQSLPKLFALASNFDDELVRHNATAALAHIDRLTRARARYAAVASATQRQQGLGFSMSSNAVAAAAMAAAVAAAGPVGHTALPSRRIGSMLINSSNQEKVHEVKLKMGYAIDDAHFRQLLMDTQVLSTKDYTKWSWDNITELLQGPLLNPKRLDEAMRSRKFIKRLLAFYRPFKHQFSDIHCTRANVIRYVKTGCTLLSTLLSHSDGVRYLEENRLLAEIAEALGELDPLRHLRDPNNVQVADPIFSKERMVNTLTSGYFTLLGVLTKQKDGSRAMEKFSLFSSLYQVSELRNRDDLKIAMITSMDYAMDGHPRVLLSKIMTSGYNPIRLFATKLVGHIMRRGDDHASTDWTIRLLVTQLYDTHLEVAQMAVQLLDEACHQRHHLELLVKCRPSLGHLGEVGHPLLLRFLSTSTGFRYLDDLDYVEKEMDEWFEFRNQQYVIQLELSLARALANSPCKKINPFEERVDSEFDFEQLQPGDGLSPPHFYGELTKTEEGCTLLREKGHFRQFTQFLRDHWDKVYDVQTVQQLKAVLWAIGNIGSTRNGLPFLEEEEIVKDIVFMAEHCEILSLKGTCFYVLGLIGKTHQGIELLGELGWEGVVDSDGLPEGLCVPLSFHDILSIGKWEYTPTLSDPPKLPKSITEDTISTDILRNIGDMSNHILANEASKNLAKLRQLHVDHFKSVPLFYSVCQLLGSYHFRSSVRKYILEAFDIRFSHEAFDALDNLTSD